MKNFITEKAIKSGFLDHLPSNFYLITWVFSHVWNRMFNTVYLSYYVCVFS